MKKIKITMIVVFCAILYGCTMASLFLPEKDYSVIENRELMQKPDITKKKVLKGKYQSQYENYLNDQIFLRDRWVSFAVAMQSLERKKDINGVYLGRDGYLLEKEDEAEFDAGQVQENIEILSDFLNAAEEEYGKDHVSCIMIPSKALAMPDKLPAYAQVPERDGVLKQLGKNLSSPEMVLDLTDEMQKHQNEYIYYRTDHHWTTLGAYYGYTAWAKATGQAAAREQKYYQRETVFTDFYGTTYNKVHVNVPADSVELFHSPGENGVSVEMDDSGKKSKTMYYCREASQGFNRYNVFFSKNTFKIEVNTNAGTGKTLLLFKDSFANCFVPFLTGDYDRIIMIDYRYGKTASGKIMEEYEDITDVLVMFQMEKFMKNTKLGKLADTEKTGSTVEEFNPDDFLE